MANDKRIETVIENLRRIWWLASYPKSGNTWLRIFLNVYVSGMPARLNDGFSQYACGDLQPAITQATIFAPLEDIDPVAVCYLRPAILMNAIIARGTSDVAMKTHSALLEVDGIPLIPPRLTKGAVYLVRDPREVAISFADHMGETIDAAIEIMGSKDAIIHRGEIRNQFHVVSSWSAHVDSWTIHNEEIPSSVVRYEDMLEDPEKTFRAILPALGFQEINEERFELAIEETRFASLKKRESEDGFREVGRGGTFFRSGGSATWRRILTEEQISRIEENHCETMKRIGYEPMLVHSK